MLEAGSKAPAARVWLAPREPVSCENLVAGRSALFVFFLFAWSST
jgi:hypothetical protein